ncbi:preprotein translocase subunit SecG [Haematomicrobium sanguinis]|uniref:preprotein translocase subunit SecG n=1 Tax=Haematomicrobium sanguinis TaxID=479106 RepID=UPI00047DFD0B|nr:preprotein translocase subunit SecG [Haematomicrobium sanguinis]
MEILNVVKIVLLVILGITSFLLTGLILLHKGRGGGVSDMFGGGFTSNLGASGVAETNLNRITVFIGLTWGLVIIALGLIQRFAQFGDS